MADMRRLAELLHSQVGEGTYRCIWQPPADIYKVCGGWLIKLDLAGVRIDEVQLSREGCQLTIHGERRDSTIREAHQTYSMEISYNRFSRAIQLPCDVTQCELRTEYRDGMLLIYLFTEPKS
jgi:HSP20 family protein